MVRGATGATVRFSQIGAAGRESNASDSGAKDRQPPHVGGFHATVSVVERMPDGGLVPSPDRHPSKAPWYRRGFSFNEVASLTATKINPESVDPSGLFEVVASA